MKTSDSLVPAQNGHLLALAFEGKSVRIFELDGEPWFVANDVCEVLEIAFVADAIRKLDDDQKGRVGVDDLPGLRTNTSTVNESGLYELIFRSSKPEAKRFRKWVTSEVLPQIRKTGGYVSTAAAGLTQLEAALVNLGREHDARIAKLETQMRPGEDWQSPADWLAAHGYPAMTVGRMSFLSARCTQKSGALALPMGRQKTGSHGHDRRTFSPQVLDQVCPAVVARWMARDAEPELPLP